MLVLSGNLGGIRPSKPPAVSVVSVEWRFPSSPISSSSMLARSARLGCMYGRPALSLVVASVFMLLLLLLDGWEAGEEGW